jgi:hypothetical protein
VAWTAKRCVQVTSSWVYQFILGCCDEFAVQFKHGGRRRRGRRVGGVPGVTCQYNLPPATARAYFQLAITWPSPGRFVRRFLYRKVAYILIKCPCPPGDCGPPVQTPCCTGPLPRTLHATGDGLGVGTFALTYDGSQYWTGQCSPSCGDAVKVRFQCQPGSSDCNGFAMDHSCDGGATWAADALALGCTCSPLLAKFGLGFSSLLGCTHCAGQDLNLTVTT